ncbi:MAG TPA: hypothetical protein VGG39_22555 [Polyangiaceae bacterium]|jgi:hypothetical protein
MGRWWIGLLVVALGCDSGGSHAGPADASSDATAHDATTDGVAPSDDGGPPPGDDGGGDEDTGVPCLDLDAGFAAGSDDCVPAGRCPAQCANGTAYAYYCPPGPDGSAAYPSVFQPPADVVGIIATVASAYPWDAGAYVSCGGLACTRWSLADHDDGGSDWPGDPCAAAATAADGGDATEAWACPLSPGVLPPGPGCVAAGDTQNIGGGDSGIPLDTVWCCPPSPDAGPPADAGSPSDASAAGDAPTE